MFANGTMVPDQVGCLIRRILIMLDKAFSARITRAVWQFSLKLSFSTFSSFISWYIDEPVPAFLTDVPLDPEAITDDDPVFINPVLDRDEICFGTSTLEAGAFRIAFSVLYQVA